MRKTMRHLGLATICFAAAAFAAHAADAGKQDSRMKGAYTFQQGGWTYVHLQGTPSQVGYQHGYLLGPQIADVMNVYQVETLHDTKRDWNFYRDAAENMLWPHIDAEYRAELTGIAEGAAARGIKVDVWDIVALNAMEELPGYYVPWLDQKEHKAVPAGAHPQDHCSAFVATGKYTKDGKIVIAHNNWSTYAEGSRWTMMFDIVPTHGHRILQDGIPGIIVSDDDFGINDAGIMSTETTISEFDGWNPDGIPEFVRARKALQYANSIDSYVAILREGNNGGYANDWLIGDRKTGEIAYLELGLKHTPLWRTKDGYFISSNFARDPGVLKDETPKFSYNDMAYSPNARRVEWEHLMAEDKGKIDVSLAEEFLADHHDSYTHQVTADSRTLCGHIDLANGNLGDWGPYYPAGSVEGKVTTSDLAAKMMLVAHAGHPCGEDFLAKPFLAAHPEYAWQAPILRDMKSGPWTEFAAGETAPAGGTSAGR
jgi:Phospholipase B